MFFVTGEASCDPLIMSIHSFDKYFCLGRIFCIPGTVLSTGDTILTQIDVIAAFIELTV